VYEVSEVTDSPLTSPTLRTRMPSLAEPDAAAGGVPSQRLGLQYGGAASQQQQQQPPPFVLDNPMLSAAAVAAAGRQRQSSGGQPSLPRLASAPAGAAWAAHADGGFDSPTAGGAGETGSGGNTPNAGATAAGLEGFVLPRSVFASHHRVPPHMRLVPPGTGATATAGAAGAAASRSGTATPATSASPAETSRPGSMVFQGPPLASMSLDSTAVTIDLARDGVAAGAASARQSARYDGGRHPYEATAAVHAPRDRLTEEGEHGEDDEDGGGGGHVPFFRADEGGLAASMIEGPGVYYLGVIDILQEWRWFKRAERLMKRYLFCLDHRGVSVIPPDEYAARFERRVVAEVIEHNAALPAAAGGAGAAAGASGAAGPAGEAAPAPAPPPVRGMAALAAAYHRDGAGAGGRPAGP
jgi:hypothetical protein